MSFVIRTSGKFPADFSLTIAQPQLAKQWRNPSRIPVTRLSPLIGRRRSRNDFNWRPDHAGIARSLDYIARHWRKPVKVADLARAAGMSRRGYLKAFLRHTGGTPARRVRSIRLENVRRMLLGGNDKLETIARQCGFRSVNTLIITFKREVGVPPIQFRQSVALRKPLRTSARTFNARRISNHLCRNLNGNL